MKCVTPAAAYSRSSPGAYAHSGAQMPPGDVGEALPGVGEALAQGELAQPRVQQRLERMRQRTAEQFDRLGVDELAQQRAAAVAPVRREVVERPTGFLVFANTERAQRFRCRVAGAGCPLRRTAASWPRSCQFASQCCMPVRQ